MKGILVRIGVDQTYGRWNAPVYLQDGEFVFVPIPEKSKMRPQLEGRYSEIPRFAAVRSCPQAGRRYGSAFPVSNCCSLHASGPRL